MMKDLVKAGNELMVWSLTVSVRGDDVLPEEVEGTHSLMKDMFSEGIVQDGIMVCERGEVERHLHCQIMLHSNFKDSNNFNASKAMKDIFDKRKVFERGFCCEVRKHNLDENRDWLSLAGCA
jgi:hypothetical protein